MGERHYLISISILCPILLIHLTNGLGRVIFGPEYVLESGQ